MNNQSTRSQNSLNDIVGLDREKLKFKEVLAKSYTSKDVRPIVWHGRPGYGKSTLKHQIEQTCQRIRMGKEEPFEKNLATASLQLRAGQMVAEQLISVRTQFARTGGYRFVLFDWAFIRWFKLAHPDASIEQRHPNMFSKNGGGVADDIIGWLNEIAKEQFDVLLTEGGLGLVEEAISLIPGYELLREFGKFLGSRAKTWWDQKEYRDAIKILDVKSEEELLELLPSLLGAGAEKALSEQRSKHGLAAATILIDGAERLGTSQDQRRAMAEWVAKFHTNAPSIFLNLFSRTEIPVPGLLGRSSILRMTGFSKRNTEELARDVQIPGTLLRELHVTAIGTPSVIKAGLYAFKQQIADMAADEAAKSAAFSKLLKGDIIAAFADQLSRDLIDEVVRHAIFASFIQSGTEERFLRYAKAALGSKGGFHLFRLVQYGLMEGVRSDDGAPHWAVPPLLARAFRCSAAYDVFMDRVAQDISIACFDLMMDEVALGGDISDGVRADLIHFSKHLCIYWDRDTVQKWEEAMNVALGAGFSDLVNEWAVNLARAIGVSGSQDWEAWAEIDIDIDCKTHLAVSATGALSHSAASLGDFHSAIEWAVLSAAFSETLDGSKFFLYTHAALCEILLPDGGEEHRFDFYVNEAISEIFAMVGSCIDFLKMPHSNDGNSKKTYMELLENVCGKDAIDALLNAHQLDIVDRWIQLYSSLSEIHENLTQNLRISNVRYSELRTALGKVSRTKEVMEVGADRLCELAAPVIATGRLSDHWIALRRMWAHSINLKSESGDRCDKIGRILEIMDGWKFCLNSEARDYRGEGAYMWLNWNGQLIYRSGQALLQVLQIEYERGNYDRVIRMCEDYELQIEELAPNSCDIWRPYIFGIFALSKAQAQPNDFRAEELLIFSVKSAQRLASKGGASKAAQKALSSWLASEVAEPLGYILDAEEDPNGQDFHYNVLPLKTPTLH